MNFSIPLPISRRPLSRSAETLPANLRTKRHLNWKSLKMLKTSQGEYWFSPIRHVTVDSGPPASKRKKKCFFFRDFSMKVRKRELTKLQLLIRTAENITRDRWELKVNAICLQHQVGEWIKSRLVEFESNSGSRTRLFKPITKVNRHLTNTNYFRQSKLKAVVL